MLASAISLEDLVIDIAAWRSAKDIFFCNELIEDARSPNYYAGVGTGVEGGEHGAIPLPSLRLLELCSISFGTETPILIQLLNMEHLSSLKLRNCPQVDELFAVWLRTRTNIALEIFELVQHDSEERHDYVPIIQFLSAFQQLKNLYLSIVVSEIWDHIASAILKHKTTLKCLVMHKQGLVAESTLHDGDVISNIEIERVLRETSPRHLGISCDHLKTVVCGTSY